MHRSRLGGFIIDCETEDLDAATRFWSLALGIPENRNPDDPLYVALDVPDGDPYLEVQQVQHPSRVHLDIETDDIDAEVRRLTALGARRIDAVRGWVVMEAPTGHRFCVVRPVRGGFGERANVWGSPDAGNPPDNNNTKMDL